MFSFVSMCVPSDFLSSHDRPATHLAVLRFFALYFEEKVLSEHTLTHSGTSDGKVLADTNRLEAQLASTLAAVKAREAELEVTVSEYKHVAQERPPDVRASSINGTSRAGMVEHPAQMGTPRLNAMIEVRCVCVCVCSLYDTMYDMMVIVLYTPSPSPLSL